MFHCDKCGGDHATYDYERHAFVCPDCGYVEVVEPKQATCDRCGARYIEFTWFHPSGCDKCHKSFVD